MVGWELDGNAPMLHLDAPNGERCIRLMQARGPLGDTRLLGEAEGPPGMGSGIWLPLASGSSASETLLALYVDRWAMAMGDGTQSRVWT